MDRDRDDGSGPRDRRIVARPDPHMSHEMDRADQHPVDASSASSSPHSHAVGQSLGRNHSTHSSPYPTGATSRSPFLTPSAPATTSALRHPYPAASHSHSQMHPPPSSYSQRSGPSPGDYKESPPEASHRRRIASPSPYAGSTGGPASPGHYNGPYGRHSSYVHDDYLGRQSHRHDYEYESATATVGHDYLMSTPGHGGNGNPSGNNGAASRNRYVSSPTTHPIRETSGGVARRPHTSATTEYGIAPTTSSPPATLYHYRSAQEPDLDRESDRERQQPLRGSPMHTANRHLYGGDLYTEGSPSPGPGGHNFGPGSRRYESPPLPTMSRRPYYDQQQPQQQPQQQSALSSGRPPAQSQGRPYQHEYFASDGEGESPVMDHHSMAPRNSSLRPWQPRTHERDYASSHQSPDSVQHYSSRQSAHSGRYEDSGSGLARATSPFQPYGTRPHARPGAAAPSMPVANSWENRARSPEHNSGSDPGFRRRSMSADENLERDRYRYSSAYRYPSHTRYRSRSPGRPMSPARGRSPERYQFNIGSYHGTPPPFDEPQYISSRSPSPVQLVSHMTERKAPPMSIAQLLSDRGSREPSPDYMNEHRHFNEDRNRMSRQDWSHAPYMSEKLKTGRESSPSGLGHFRDQSPGQDLPKHHIHANLPHSVQPATALAEKNKKHTTARAGRTEHSSIRREPTGSSSRGSGYSQYGRAHSPDYEGYYSKGAAGSSSRSNRYPDEFHPPPHMGLYEETQSISTESTRTDHWPEREQSEAPSLHPRDMHERHGQTPIQIKRRVPTEIGIRSSRVKTEEVKPKGRRGRKPKEREIPLEAPGTKLPIEPEGGVASSLSLYDDHPISSRAAHAGPGIGGDSWSRRPRRSDSLTDVQQVHEAIRNIGLDQNERAAGGFGDKARDMSSRRLEAPPTRRSDLSDIDPEDVALYSDMRKRGPRDHYEKQAMQKRRKLQESGLESQNRMTGSSVLGPDAMDDDGYLGSRASYEGSSMSGAPSHSHLAIPTRGRGRGRRKLQATSADSRLRYGLGEGRGSSGAMSQETKAEKKRRERKAAAQAAAMAQVEAIKARARAHENGHSVITSSSGGRAGPSSPGNAPSASGMDYDDDEPDAHVPRSIPFDADSDGAEFSQDGRADFDVSDDEEGDGEDMTNHLDDRGIKHELMFEETPAQRQEREYEARRRAIWDLIAHRHIREATKVVALTTSTKLSNCKKVAQLCQREARKAAARSVKSSKEIHARARRANREMLFFWKRNEKEERDMRKKAEKEAIERLRIEEEMREARRQARKLNFLITQTELYSHFIGKKIGTEAAETDDDDARVRMQPNDTSEASILQDPNHTPIQGELDFEEASDETLEAQAKWGAQQALLAAQQRTKTFDEADKEHREDRRTMSINQDDFDEMNFQNPSSMPTGAEIEQPKMLMCQLKGYQIKGLNWLANLYEQGINGILADEMGLGKTVQSISLMAYLAEVQNIWGPFLVIAPASTLHNWQQEFAKFTPGLKALPYWGNPTDRKTLRKIWTKKQIYTKDSPFHVVVTSYQLVVSDEKYFQRVKWQYMVLDEAQAIKSSSSARWKTLLGFNCRNRLLLTGTPIQNSMQELWALLHFIMPSLFDSHEEFSEWFSKDIESHAENKGTLNEHQLKRLHMILKPFMLRRIKKNVQNELGDKIELEVRCELTARQRALYRGLKDKISISELLEKASSLNDTDSVDSLMNLVMQFRKVCNHPELFERADVASPLALCAFSQTPSIAREGDDLYVAYTTRSNISYSIPKRFYRDGGLLNIPCESSNAGSDTKYLDNLLNIWNPGNIVESMYEQDGHGAFSFLRFVDYSPSEANKLFHASVMDRFCHHLETAEVRSRRGYGLRGDGIHSLEEEDPEAAGNTFARLEISEANNLFSPHNTLLSHMQPLGRVLPQSNIGQSLTIMEPAFRPKAVAPPIEMICSDRGFLVEQRETLFDIRIRQSLLGLSPLITEIPSQPEEPSPVTDLWQVTEGRGILGEPTLVSMGYSTIAVPQMKQLVMDSGKLAVLDKLLVELKAGGHRVLLYFQMTRMIDLMEEYLTYRQYKYLRLDGSSKISDRRDMVTDWQTRPEIFIFLLSTRAGGLGINLTAADTVIFYDSDWNPTVDQQAMDRAHRLGQTRQVTVYRLITRGTIEERILTRAKQKDEIQKVVISGGEFKQSVEFKPREIVSLLLDDDELATKLQEQQMKRKVEEEEAKQSRKSIKEARGEARPTKRARRGDKGEAGSSSNGNGKGLSSSGNVSTPPGSLVGTPGIESEGTNGSPGNGSGEDKVRGATTTGVRRRRGRGSKEMGEPREPRRGRGGGRGGRKASRLGQVTTLGDEGGEGGRTVNMDDLDVDLEGL